MAFLFKIIKIFLAILSAPFFIIGFIFSFIRQGIEDGIMSEINIRLLLRD